MRVRIVRKLADCVDGVDLTRWDVGEVVELPERDGRLVVAEQWAVPARRQADLADGGEPAARASMDRRQEDAADLYQRLKAKRDEIDRDRRHLLRRSSDADTTSAA